MKTFALILSLACAAGACDKDEPTSTTQTTASTTSAPDDPRTNAREDASSVTPFDQGTDRADLGTTQAIRKAIMADDSLSTGAKNVKVATNAGIITLRGPVKSDAEKTTIESKAFAAAGSHRVDDQIEVQGN